MDVNDAVVAGLGIHGSSTIAQLAERGKKVIGFEKFQKGGHPHGSSHGRSRIIRQAYFEDPRYVPLLKRSFELWRKLEELNQSINPSSESNRNAERLLTMTGGIMLGKSDSDVVKGTLASVKQHNLNHEVLTAEQIKVRFPVFQPDNDEIGIFESEAGYLNPEKCVNAYQLMAGHFGAQLHFHESVASWKEVLHETMGVIIEVSTDSGRVVHTRKLVLAVGAWAPQVYGSVLPMDLYAERRVLYWFQPTAHVKKFKDIPVYIWDIGSHSNFYGFPTHDPLSTDTIDSSTKVAYHQANINSTDELKCTPDTIVRDVTEAETNELRKILAQKIPYLNGKLVHNTTCMYTSIKDDFFLIDYHPEYTASKSVIMLSACSGHGFKFGSVVGEIVADLVEKETTTHDISIFRLHR